MDLCLTSMDLPQLTLFPKHASSTLLTRPEIYPMKALFNLT
jgi:hypothetical protein